MQWPFKTTVKFVKTENQAIRVQYAVAAISASAAKNELDGNSWMKKSLATRSNTWWPRREQRPLSLIFRQAALCCWHKMQLFRVDCGAVRLTSADKPLVAIVVATNVAEAERVAKRRYQRQGYATAVKGCGKASARRAGATKLVTKQTNSGSGVQQNGSSFDSADRCLGSRHAEHA